MTRFAILLLLVIACGSKDPEPEPPPPEPEPPKEKSLKDRFGGLADRAKSIGDGVVDDVVDKARGAAAKAGELSADAVSSGNKLKTALGGSNEALRGKLALAKLDYDLAVESVEESEAAHRSALSRMKQVDIGSYKVGWERHSKHPMGEVYKWQFRVTWRVPATGKAVRLSLFTDHELPELDLVNALATIVPLAERLVP